MWQCRHNRRLRYKLNNGRCNWHSSSKWPHNNNKLRLRLKLSKHRLYSSNSNNSELLYHLRPITHRLRLTCNIRAFPVERAPYILHIIHIRLSREARVQVLQERRVALRNYPLLPCR